MRVPIVPALGSVRERRIYKLQVFYLSKQLSRSNKKNLSSEPSYVVGTPGLEAGDQHGCWHACLQKSTESCKTNKIIPSFLRQKFVGFICTENRVETPGDDARRA